MEGHSTFDNDQLFIDSAGILTIECGQAPRNCDSIIHIPNNHVAPQAIAEAICGRYQLRTPTDSDRQHFRSPEAILDFCQQMNESYERKKALLVKQNIYYINMYYMD